MPIINVKGLPPRKSVISKSPFPEKLLEREQKIMDIIIAKMLTSKAVIKLEDEQVLINSWLVDKIMLLIEIILKSAIASIFSNFKFSMFLFNAFYKYIKNSFQKINYISIFYLF